MTRVTITMLEKGHEDSSLTLSLELTPQECHLLAGIMDAFQDSRQWAKNAVKRGLDPTK